MTTNQAELGRARSAVSAALAAVEEIVGTGSTGGAGGSDWRDSKIKPMEDLVESLVGLLTSELQAAREVSEWVGVLVSG